MLAAWRDWTETTPDEITSVGRIFQFPPIEVIPEPLRGRNLVVVEVAYMGDEASGRELLAAAARARARDVDARDDPGRRPRAPARRPRGPHARPSATARCSTSCPTRRSPRSSTSRAPARARRSSPSSCASSAARSAAPPPAPAPPRTSRARSSSSRSGCRSRPRWRRRSRRTSTSSTTRWRRGRAARRTSTSPSAGSRARRLYAGATHDRLREIRERFDPSELFRANHRIQPAGADW